MNIQYPTGNTQPNKVGSENGEWRESTPRIRVSRSLGRWIFPVGYWILLSLFLLAVLPTHARVFWRWGGRSDAGRALRSLGATRAYAAPVVINGGRGSLSVYGLDLPFGSALRQIGKTLGVTFDFSSEASMAVETVDTPSGRLRVIAIAPPDITRTLVFLLEQSRAEANRSSGPPPTIAMPHVPDFPGSTPIFVATDEKARAGLAVSRTVASSESVGHFYHEQLRAGGWLPALPGGAPGVYLKGQAICCVQAYEQNRETHITVLHKELSNKPNP
jgi:hypothetical protein